MMAAKVKRDDFLIFLIKFSNMIDAGIDIVNSLRMLARQSQSAALKETLERLVKSLEAGDSLSSAMAKEPVVFSNLLVKMIKAGEAGGQIDTVLARYAQFYERQQDLRQKVKSASVYPIVLLCAGIGVTLILVTFVMPQFMKIFFDMGVDLPLPTVVVYVVGTSIKRYWYLIAGVVALIVYVLRRFIKTEKGALIVDGLKLRAPVFGTLYQRVATARFSNTLATLFASGVPVLESLNVSKDVLENRLLASSVKKAAESVAKGEPIAKALSADGRFPLDLTQMIAVGEETGRLDNMLAKIASLYDMLVDYAIKRLVTLIEPLFLILMGGIVGFIMAAMFLPLFQIVSAA